jgi:hypothetical protein
MGSRPRHLHNGWARGLSWRMPKRTSVSLPGNAPPLDFVRPLPRRPVPAQRIQVLLLRSQPGGVSHQDSGQGRRLAAAVIAAAIRFARHDPAYFARSAESGNQPTAFMPAKRAWQARLPVEGQNLNERGVLAPPDCRLRRLRASPRVASSIAFPPTLPAPDRLGVLARPPSRPEPLPNTLISSPAPTRRLQGRILRRQDEAQLLGMIDRADCVAHRGEPDADLPADEIPVRTVTESPGAPWPA